MGHMWNPSPERLKQEAQEIEATLSYMTTLSQKQRWDWIRTWYTSMKAQIQILAPTLASPGPWGTHNPNLLAGWGRRVTGVCWLPALLKRWISGSGSDPVSKEHNSNGRGHPKFSSPFHHRHIPHTDTQGIGEEKWKYKTISWLHVAF